MLKMFVVGRLGRDPEMRYSADGNAFTRFSMATDVGWGENKKTVWLQCVAFGKRAEVINQYLKKGSQVAVECTLNPDGDTGGPRVWERGDGTWGASYDVTVNDVKFLSRLADDNDSGISDPPSGGDQDELPW